MNRANQITALVFFLLSVFVAREALVLKYYTVLGPGPGFFPLWLALLLGGLSLGLFYQATWGKAKDEPLPEGFFATRIGYSHIGAILVASAAVVALMEPLGYRLTILAYLLFLLFALGRINMIATALVSLAGSFGVFYVFVDLLKVPLPVGTFGF